MPRRGCRWGRCMRREGTSELRGEADGGAGSEHGGRVGWCWRRRACVRRCLRRDLREGGRGTRSENEWEGGKRVKRKRLGECLGRTSRRYGSQICIAAPRDWTRQVAGVRFASARLATVLLSSSSDTHRKQPAQPRRNQCCVRDVRGLGIELSAFLAPRSLCRHTFATSRRQRFECSISNAPPPSADIRVRSLHPRLAHINRGHRSGRAVLHDQPWRFLEVFSMKRGRMQPASPTDRLRVPFGSEGAIF